MFTKFKAETKMASEKAVPDKSDLWWERTQIYL